MTANVHRADRRDVIDCTSSRLKPTRFGIIMLLDVQSRHPSSQVLHDSSLFPHPSSLSPRPVHLFEFHSNIESLIPDGFYPLVLNIFHGTVSPRIIQLP